MIRKNCPICGREVGNGSDKMMTENGRGTYKTKILFHRSCYEKEYIRRVNKKWE